MKNISLKRSVEKISQEINDRIEAENIKSIKYLSKKCYTIE